MRKGEGFLMATQQWDPDVCWGHPSPPFVLQAAGRVTFPGCCLSGGEPLNSPLASKPVWLSVCGLGAQDGKSKPWNCL